MQELILAQAGELGVLVYPFTDTCTINLNPSVTFI